MCGAVVLLVGCGSQSPARSAPDAGSVESCTSLDACVAETSAQDWKPVLAPRAPNLEFVAGRVSHATRAAPQQFSEWTMRDSVTGRKFKASVVAQAISTPEAVERASMPNGCETTPVMRTAVSSGGRPGCYEHRGDFASDDFKATSTITFHANGLIYRTYVLAPDEPRGTAPSPLQQWLTDLLDTYA